MASKNNNRNNKANANNATDKVVKSMAADISAAATAVGISREELMAKLAAKLELDVKFNVNSKVGDVEAEVPILSNNVVNITIGDVTIAERGGVIGGKKKKKKGDKKKNKK